MCARVLIQPKSIHNNMADNSILDSILEDALQEYENVDSAAAAPTTTPPQQNPEEKKEEKDDGETKVPQPQGEEKLFPPSSDEMAATFQALMSQFGAPADGDQPSSSSSSSSSGAPISDDMAESQADEAIKGFLSAISSGAAPSGGAAPGGDLNDPGFGALLGLLKPFISKELLYGPLSQSRALVNKNLFIFNIYLLFLNGLLVS